MQCRRVDRRLFLGAGALTLIGAAGASRAQAQAPQAAGVGGTALKPTARVVDFVAGFDLKAVPALAIERARLAFIDTVGVMLAGSRSARRDRARARAHEGAAARGLDRRAVVALLAAALPRWRTGSPRTRSTSTSPTQAAARARDPRAPSARREHRRDAGGDARGLHRRLRGLLAAEPRQSQPQRRRRLARHRHHRHDRRGAARARLIKLPAAKIPDVLGIAVSMAAGVNANYGTMTKPLHAGQAARNAIVAAQLGARSFTANPAAIEGRGGFASTFARGLEWQPQAFDDLGRSSIWPSAASVPSAIPAGRDPPPASMRRSRSASSSGRRWPTLSPSRPASRNTPPTARASSTRPIPRRRSSICNTSWPIRWRTPTLSAFGEEAIRDEREALARLVSVSIDPEFADAREDYPTRLTLTLKDDGIEELYVYASGTARYIRCRRRRSAKFRDCAKEAVAPERAETRHLARARRCAKFRGFLAAGAQGIAAAKKNAGSRVSREPAFARAPGERAGG